MVGRDAFALGGLHAADLRRHDREHGAFLLDRAAERIEHAVVHAVGDQGADLAAPQRRLRLLDQTQGGRLVEVDRSARRREPLGFPHHAQRFLDRGAQGPLDDHQVAEHALADRDGLDLAELEGKGADDVALLRLAHRAEELPRLAVVIGEALGADAQLVARSPDPRRSR